MKMSHAAAKPSPSVHLEPPRFKNIPALLIAGLRKSYAPGEMNGIPEQWQRLAPYIGKIPVQIDRTAYGVCWQATDNASIEYLAGVEVSGFAGLPTDFTVVSLPAAKYAVFPHHGHVSMLYETCDGISKWLPESGHQSAAAADLETPAFFERYSEEFDPRTGMGGMEVWVPLQS
jgi:AraC family transcriptional regulator